MIHHALIPRVRLDSRAALRSLFLVIVLAFGSACSGQGEDRPPGWNKGEGPGSPSSGGGPCAEGTEKLCSVTIHQANGIVSCWEGVQECVDGEWGPCSRGTLVERPDPTSDAAWGGEFRPASLSGLPRACLEDACDPSCQTWFEEGALIGGGDGLPRYPGFPEAELCTHDLCTVGSALDPNCNECATTVCQADPDCCNPARGWDEACVSFVHFLCAEREPPFNLCDYTLFADSNLRLNGMLTSDIQIGANHNAFLGVDTQVGRVVAREDVVISNGNSPATIVGRDGIYARRDVRVEAGTRTGPIVAGRNVMLNSNVHALNDVRAQGWINGQDNSSRILGSAFAGTTIGTYPLVSGQRVPNSDHPPFQFNERGEIPRRTLDCTGTGQFYGNGSAPTPAARVVTLEPGVYDFVELSNGGVLELGPGDYTFNRLSLNGSIRLRDTSAPTNLNVCGNLSFGNNARILEADNTQLDTPTTFVVYVGGQNVWMETNVHFTGILIAPQGDLYKSPGGSIHGMIWACEVNLQPGQTITGMSRSECLGAGIPEVQDPPLECPIPRTTPAVPRALNEPCASGLDCQMNHRCTEPVTGSSCAHGKCQAGAALATECDPCVARVCDEDPSCCATAWTAACVARVATACDAVCGGGDSGLCVPNEEGYRDATCAGYDLALGVSCNGLLPVCNHGTQAFSGAVRVGYFAESDRLMATPHPQRAREDGRCEGNLTIPAGSCAELPCALPDARYTLFVEPVSAPFECDDRRLDNWTVVDRAACDQENTVVHTFDYLATCETPGTSPRWGLLTWRAEVRDTSRIEFSARTGVDAADAAARPFEPLGTATSARPNCSRSDTLPCPVDVTRELDLGRHQGSHLDLRIELVSAPGVETFLQDWRLTYSCVFDE